MATSNSGESPNGTLQAIVYTSALTSGTASLQILDQLALPHQTIYIKIAQSKDAFTAIKNMSVRGAPAIAIVAALSVAAQITSPESLLAHSDTKQVHDEIIDALNYLLTSRPTAVNLRDAVTKLSKITHDALSSGDKEVVRAAYVAAAEKMLVDDVSDNEAIGQHGAEWIERNIVAAGKKVAVLTHCNTGSLATAGYGTALGIIRSLHAKQLLSLAYYSETRPYNQGSRLTGYELIHDQIPSTLITDSMAAALFQKCRSEGQGIASVIVGADRVAANGDTANKIGTYALAVLARYHGVKFLVAAPRTTIDLTTPSGKEIVIEQRPPEEMLSVKGPKNMGYSSANGIQTVDLNTIESVSTAALGTRCWNPAFDVTPAELIDGIVTEVGVVEKNGQGVFDLQRLFTQPEIKNDLQEGKKRMPDPAEGP